MERLQLKTEYDRDEITLLDLMLELWKQKWLILIITLICFGIGATYLLIAKPVYEAKAYIVSPTEGDISKLNVGRSYSKNSPVKMFRINEVYNIFSDVLLSESIKQDFFKQVYLPSLSAQQRESLSEEKLFNNFLKKFLIKEDSHAIPVKYTIIADTDNPAKAREMIIQYVALAEKKALFELKTLIDGQYRVLAINIERKIVGIKEVAKNNRIDRLAQLNEALTIAKETGVVKFAMNTSLTNLDAAPMLYMRGSKALESEIRILSSRKTDDSFASNLRNLEIKYNFYRNLNVPIDAIRMFRVDGDITLPEAPIKPKVFFILMVSLFTGILLGSFTALIRNAFLRKKLNVI